MTDVSRQPFWLTTETEHEAEGVVYSDEFVEREVADPFTEGPDVNRRGHLAEDSGLASLDLDFGPKTGRYCRP
jgi:hypothetical protein